MPLINKKLRRYNGKKRSRKVSKKVSRKVSKKVSRKMFKKVSRKMSKKVSRKMFKKVSRKMSKKVSRKMSKKVSKKGSRKISRKVSRKQVKRVVKKSTRLPRKQKFGAEEVGGDVYRYRILPSLDYNELVRFARTSKSNLALVESYLQTFKKPLSLSRINNDIKFFSEIDTPTLQHTMETLRQSRFYRNKTEEEIKAAARRRNGIIKIPTEFSIEIINNIFEILGAEYQYFLKIDGNNDVEDKMICVVDYSNLPLLNKSFTSANLSDKKFAVKIETVWDTVNIKVFLGKGYSQEMYNKLKEVANEIDEAREDHDYITNTQKFQELYKDRNKYGNLTLGVIFTFEIKNIKNLTPREGFNLVKDLLPKKKGMTLELEDL